MAKRRTAKIWTEGGDVPSDRPEVPTTLAQMKVLADRAERDRLTTNEANRLRRGLERLAALEKRNAELEEQNQRLRSWAKKRRGLFDELAERVSYWNQRADILEIRTAVVHCQDILRKAVTDKEHDQ